MKSITNNKYLFSLEKTAKKIVLSIGECIRVGD